MYRIEIEGRMPTLNEWLSGTHWRKKHADKKLWEVLFKNEFRKERLQKPLNVPITLNATVFSKRPKDPDNVVLAAKFMLDALVASGYLKDDSYEDVTAITLQSKKGKEEKTVILICP